MSETLRLTVVYEDAGDGWVMASIAELPAVLTQGATIDEVRTMVHSARRDWLAIDVQHGDRPEPVKAPTASRWTSSPARETPRPPQAATAWSQCTCAVSAPLASSRSNSWSKRFATGIVNHTCPHAGQTSTGTLSTSAVLPSRSARRARRSGRRSP